MSHPTWILRDSPLSCLSRSSKHFNVLNVKDLNRFEANTNLDIEVLKEAGVIKKAKDGIKILGEGEISHPLFIKAHKASKTAMDKIEAAGGKIEII